MKKIWLAGPEVFLKNATEIYEQKKILCDKYGFQGFVPLDKDINLPHDFSPYDMGMEIYYNNKSMMDECDCIVANMTPYHGVSCDVGTAYEMGYMMAQGKPVFSYSNDPTPFINRQKDRFPHYVDDDDGLYRDSCTHMRFINTDMCDNLMMVGATVDTTKSDPLVAETPNSDRIAMHTRMDMFEKTLQRLSHG